MSKETQSTLAEFGREQGLDRSQISPMDIDDGLRRLGVISRQLRSVKVFTMMDALSTLVFTILAAILPRVMVIYGFEGATRFLALFFVYPLALAGILTLFVWDRRRAEGKVLFEEISDEFEWHHRTFKPDADHSRSTPDSAKPRVDFRIRVLLREFLDASTMPFIPGPFGAAWYLVFYIGCMVLAVFVSSM